MFFSMDFFSSFISKHPMMLLAIALMLMAIIIFFSLFYHAARKKELRKFARRYGWKFLESWKTPEELFEQTGFDFFKDKTSANVSNFIIGIENSYSKIEFFDYSYEIYEPFYENEADKYRRQYFSCALILLNEGRLPAFRMEPETLLTRLGEKTGLQDIDFDEAPDFSDNYRLEGDDIAEVRKFFNRTVLYAFERQKGLRVYAKDRKLLIINQQVGTGKIYYFLEKARDIASTLGAEAKK